MTDQMRKALLPCPFCGETEIIFVESCDFVACSECGVTMEDLEPSTVECWNTREALTASPGERPPVAGWDEAIEAPSDLYAISDVDLLDYCGADGRKWAEAFCQIKKKQGWSSDDIDEGLMTCWFANAIENSSALRREAPVSSGGAPFEWHDGSPPKPWCNEWFIASTTFNDRVVLTALPEEYTYDFKTADDTYIKADKIKRWMQFPDSQFIPPSAVETNASAEAEFPSWTDEDKAYELGRRDGYESAVQDIDLATGGDGEFKGSTISGETVDVPAMKQRVIERFANASAEARLPDWGQIVQILLRCMDATIKNETSREQAERMANELLEKYPALSADGGEAKKSDGLCHCSWGCVEADNCRRREARKQAEERPTKPGPSDPTADTDVESRVRRILCDGWGMSMDSFMQRFAEAGIGFVSTLEPRGCSQPTADRREIVATHVRSALLEYQANGSFTERMRERDDIASRASSAILAALDGGR